jgi:hypothetical protein
LKTRVERRRQALNDEIARLQAAYQADVDSYSVEALHASNEAQREADEAEDAARAELEPAIEQLTVKHTEARTKALANARDKGNATLADRLEKEAVELQAEADEYTNRIEAVEEVRNRLLTELPIKGLAIVGGKLMHTTNGVGFVPFDTLNEAMRVKLAIEVARLTAGEIEVVCVDGLERLDAKTFAEFERQAEESGLQFFVSRVAKDGSLKIREL